MQAPGFNSLVALSKAMRVEANAILQAALPGKDLPSSEPEQYRAKGHSQSKAIKVTFSARPKTAKILLSGPVPATLLCSGKDSTELNPLKRSPSSPSKLRRLLDPVVTTCPPNLRPPVGLNIEMLPKLSKKRRCQMKSIAEFDIGSKLSLRFSFLATCVVTLLLLALRQESILAISRNQAAGHRSQAAMGHRSMPTPIAPKLKAATESQALSSSSVVAKRSLPRLSPAASPIPSTVPTYAVTTASHDKSFTKSAGVVFHGMAGKVPQGSPTCDLKGVHIIFDGIMYKKERGQMLGINKMWFEILPFMGEMVRKLGGKLTHCASFDLRIPNVDHLDGKLHA